MTDKSVSFSVLDLAPIPQGSSAKEAFSHSLDLAQLAEKWPLVAITNGNAQPELFGLSDYFRFVLRAGPDGRSKPFADMYHLAAERLALPLGQILHVGDDLTTDVAGSIRCGMQACWIKPQGADLMRTADSRLLPHIEISRLASLTSLI